MRRCVYILFFVFAGGLAGSAQEQLPNAESTEARGAYQKPGFVRNVYDLFNMAGVQNASDFRAMSQPERNSLYLRSMVNPLSFVRIAASGGIDQAKDKPEEWEEGASGYGKRFANIFAQYSIQRTVTYGLGSAFHEDNRYFNSGKHAFWPRAGYALRSGIVARHDDGSLHFSISQVGGVAAGAFLARVWLPPSQQSAADAGISFGITMGTNIGFGVVKEFLPDLVRPFTRGRAR